jgi:uncharacterized membrane protein
MTIFLLLLFYVLFPALIIYLTKKFPLADKLGAVAIAYGIGLVFGSIGILPARSEDYKILLGNDLMLPAAQALNLFEIGKITLNDLVRNKISSLQSTLNDISVIIAIPLLLFSLDLRKWFKMAGKTILSVFLALLSVIIVVYAGFFIFMDKIEDSSSVAGMLIGIYSGGTPNVAAIGKALNVDPTLFIVVNAYDIIIGAFCLFFLITIAQRVFLFFLPAFSKTDVTGNIFSTKKETSDIDDYSGMFKKDVVFDILKGLGLSIGVLAFSAFLGSLVPKESETTVIILSVTTLGLVLSLIPKINRLKKTFQTGMYLIIMFCMIIASMADLTNLFRIEYLEIFLYVFMVVFGSLFVHVLLSMIFKIDADTVIITSTAMVYSPPFVPVVAGALKNKEVIISGVTAGMAGYVLGNFLGIFTGDFLAGFL